MYNAYVLCRFKFYHIISYPISPLIDTGFSNREKKNKGKCEFESGKKEHTHTYKTESL